MKTTWTKEKDIQKNWYHVDATGKTLGRLSSQIAYILRGKHKETFIPNMDVGDFVVVTNAEKVVLKGTKWTNKFYYRHTGFIGGIKETRADVMRDTHPERIIEKAVWGMLPKNALGRKIQSKLKVYPGTEHPHGAQEPKDFPMERTLKTS